MAPSRSLKPIRQYVDFICHAPAAAQVCLVGDFNEWRPTANPMRRASGGDWAACLELDCGYHQYLFVVDGKPGLIQTRWVSEKASQ